MVHNISPLTDKELVRELYYRTSIPKFAAGALRFPSSSNSSRYTPLEVHLWPATYISGQW
jgi:hypothetical protein